MKIIDRIALVLLILAGLNWGTVGVADFNSVMWIFIAQYHVQHTIYILFGLAALWTLFRLFQKKGKR